MAERAIKGGRRVIHRSTCGTLKTDLDRPMEAKTPEAKPLLPASVEELEKPKVLVVDESSSHMAAVETLLARVEITLFEATALEEALSLMARHDFALVLVRAAMAEGAGWELASQMRSGGHTHQVGLLLLVDPAAMPHPPPIDTINGFTNYAHLPLEDVPFIATIHQFLQLHRLRRGWEKELLKRKNLEAKLRSSGNGEESPFIATRRFFQHQFLVEWRRMLREYKPFTLIMVDVDLFEAYREQYGVQATDHLVLKIGHAIRNSISRSSDFVARLENGGFVVVLPNTDSQGAGKVAERVKNNVGLLGLEHKAAPRRTISVSLGVACVITSPHIQPKQFIDLADQALYKAKKHGGGHIEVVQLL